MKIASCYTKQLIRRIASAIVGAVLSGGLWVMTPATFAQGFGTITPGGVQPNLDRQLPPKATPQPEYDVPAVPERPLGDEQGPKIVVTRFQLEGVDDVPETEVNQRNVNLLLEELRRQQPEGFTIGQLQAVANEVTRYYRQHGMILALAIVPQQDVKDGVVTISVLPGELGQLTTANNKNYSDALLKKPLLHLLESPVQVAQIESALLRLNDLPGLEAAGVFRPGENIGETQLVLNTVSEEPFQFTVFADNHGIETTGEQRLIAGVSWNNPLGMGDKLSVNALQTFDPEDSTYGAISYETQLFVPEWRGGISHSVNDYAVAQSVSRGIPATGGETRITSLYGKYFHTRSRRLNITGIIDLSTKHADLELKDFNFELGEDKLTVLSLGVDMDNVDSWMGGGINEISLFYHQGIPEFLGSMDKHIDEHSLRTDSNGNSIIGGDFEKLSYDVTRLQLINSTNVLLLRLQGQFTEDPLSSIEQFVMGGPSSVRAYPVTEYIRDKGVFVSAEWTINAPGFSDKPAFNGRTWGEVLTFSVFADYANGRSNDTLPAGQRKEQDISGIGIGLAFKPTDTSFFKFEAATPTTGEEPSNDDDPQLWFSAGVEF